MSDIRKRDGKKGTTYQVRYRKKSAKSGYAFRTFKTMKEARAFRDDSLKFEQEHVVSTSTRTVDQAVDKWLDICTTEGTENHEPVTRYTLKTYEYRANIIKKYDWNKPLQELRASDVRSFKSWLIDNCAGRHQAMKVMSSFHTVLQEMALRDIVSSNVASGITIRMDSRSKKKIVPPSEKEVVEILAAADRLANSKRLRIAKSWQRYRPILYLAADTGARPQEYLAAPLSNVTKHDIKIDRAIERGGHKMSAPKSEAGIRWIDLSPEVSSMARHYGENYATPNQYDLLFPTSAGRWQLVSTWRKRGFCLACMEAGLVEKVEEDGEVVEKPKYTSYDLRHFYASMLIAQRVNLKRIQQLLGHESITTTLNHYGHIIDRVETAHEVKTGLLGRMKNKPCGEFVA